MFEVRIGSCVWFRGFDGLIVLLSRFATELAGRKARKRGWDGLAEEMTKAGWFES